LTEPKAAGTPFVVKRRKKKYMLFKMIVEGTIHVYLPPRAMSLRLDFPTTRTHVFRTILLSRSGNMTTVDSYLGFSSEVKYLAFFYRLMFLSKKGERQDLERLKAAAEAQQLE
jgi:hypothetical protein